LKELDISGNYHANLDAIHELSKQVKKTRIATLKLNRIMLPGGCKKLFPELQQSQTLRKLEVNTAGFDSNDAPYIADGLKHCLQLQSLDLSIFHQMVLLIKISIQLRVTCLHETQVLC